MRKPLIAAALITLLVPIGALHAAEPDPPGVIDGELVEPCAWPTAGTASFAAGLFGTRCGAALIHPELVAVIPECVNSSQFLDSVTLGDNDESSQEVAAIGDSCVVHFDGWFAVCRLAAPVDLPLNPIVYGCESGIAEPGREVVLAGFGRNELSEQETGNKYWARGELESTGEVSVLVSEAGPTSCRNSDLGAPLYVEYPDGTWHMLAIASETLDCAGTTSYRRLDHYVPWIEATFDVDVTPCHDGDGTWAPSEDCTNLSMAGPVGGGTWADWCSETPTLPLSETCGPGFGEAAGDPIVVIDAPIDQAVIPSGEATSIEVAINHAVVGAQIEINGMLQPAVDETWPYEFADVPFPDGTYTIVAFAEGEDGVTRESAPIEIQVGDGVPGDGDGDGDTEDTGDTGESGPTEEDSSGDDEVGDTGSEAGADDGQATESCACTVEPRAPGSLTWASLGLLALVRIRRRSR